MFAWESSTHNPHTLLEIRRLDYFFPPANSNKTPKIRIKKKKKFKKSYNVVSMHKFAGEKDLER